MPKKYQLTQNGEEVQALLNKIAGLNNLSDLRSDSSHRTVTDAEKATWNGKQSAIQDLDAIRNGASLGATAYQKPSGGIPASDLADGVVPTIPTDIVRYTPQILTDLQKAQARTNIGATASEVFVATYGSTTYAEITAAISDNKVVIVKRVTNAGTSDENIAFYGSPNNILNFVYIFSRLIFDPGHGSATEQIGVRADDVWEEAGQKILEDSSYKVSAWSSTPNDYQYPTEKLVKDSLDGKQDTIDASHKLDYSLLSNTPTIPDELADLQSDSTHRVVTDTEKTTWNGKQNAINDLATIRSGASAGATAYQKPVGGIPSSDLASGVIPDVSQFITKSVNDLANYYLKSETYTKDEVASLIGAIQQFHYEIAASTSAVTNPSNNVLYLIGPTGSGADKYEEYVYSNGWVKIGDTSIDLSGYVTTQALNTALSAYTTTNDLTTLLAGKQDTIDAQHKLDYSLIANTPTIPTVPTDIVKYTAQTLTDAQKAQARTNIGATYPEVFWVSYDSAATPKASKTWVEIFNAANANRIPILVESFTVYYYVGISQVDYSLNFAANVDGKIRNWNVSANNEWTLTELSPEFTSNKVASWQATPDNTHYPSEKLVKDSLDGKQPTIDAQHKLDYSLLSNTPTIPAAQVNADWNASSGVAQILNKPTIPAAQVNSDWNASSGVAQILNKPNIPSTYAGSPTAGGFANKTVAIPFGTVDSTSTATVMTATVDNFPTTLTDGVCAYIRNDVIASASGWTLNINGTGALPVYASNADASRTTTIFAATTTFLFVYNSSRVSGGCWDLYYGYDSNTNTIGYQVRTNSYSLPMKSITYRYRLLFTSADGEHFVPANNSSSTNATSSRTVCQNPIDPFGKIVYYGTTASVAANARPAAANLWSQYALSLGYSFNRTGAALVLTTWKPVYVKCAPQADGSAIIDSTTPYVQDLPTTTDGKIYIYLGVAYSATNIELAINHPVYYYDGTRATIWPGPVIGDIQTALDAIIGTSLISFNVTRGSTTSYQAEEGMTWGDWVESEYNTDGWTNEHDLATNRNYIWRNGYAIWYNGNGVLPTDTILNNTTYTTVQIVIED